MSKFTTRKQLLDEITKERYKLEVLLAEIPDNLKQTIIDENGMSVKDYIAHRTEWGRMMLRWYSEGKTGKKPAIPTEKYKWNQLKELNAEIKDRFADTPLGDVMRDFKKVHDELYTVIEGTTDKELFTKKHYAFTGASDLATYFNSSTASHYRSARRYINKWWKAYNNGGGSA